MAPLAQFMEWLCIAAWCVGVAAHIYASRYFLPMWASGFKRKPQHEGYGRKALIDYAFLSAQSWSALRLAGLPNWPVAGAANAPEPAV